MRLILFTGSRGWTNSLVITDCMELFRELLGDYRVMHGGATGADQFVRAAAKRMRLPSDIVMPDYLQYGRYEAPKRRNIRMLERHPDLVVGFWDGESGGTKHCLFHALNTFKIPTLVITC